MMADHPESDLYVRKKGRVFGPYNFETLQGLAQKGQLSRSHEVSEDGINWIRAGKYQPPIWEKWAAPPPPPPPPQPEVPEISAEAGNSRSPVTASPQIAPQDADQQWYYTQNEQEMGPIGFAQLQQLFATGGLASHEDVWTDGMPDWQPASQVPQLQSCFGRPAVNPAASNPAASAVNRAMSVDRKQPASGDNPLNWYFGVWKKYAEFSGRARRKEYWWFVLFNAVLLFALGFVLGLIGAGEAEITLLSSLYNLAALLPSLGVVIRRLHDTGRSGWWWLIIFVPFLGIIVLIVFLAQAGDSGDNQYGPNPIDPVSG